MFLVKTFKALTSTRGMAQRGFGPTYTIRKSLASKYLSGVRESEGCGFDSLS
jgi:hypothetical protein